MRILKANTALGLTLVSVPVLAELGAAARGRSPGIGLDVLLYWPFNFAFALIALLLFATLNAYLFAPSRGNLVLGAATGVFLSLFWFILAFLVIAQLHLILGGQL